MIPHLKCRSKLDIYLLGSGRHYRSFMAENVKKKNPSSRCLTFLLLLPKEVILFAIRVRGGSLCVRMTEMGVKGNLGDNYLDFFLI